MAERLGRPRLQPKQLNDRGMAVVGLIDVAHERLEVRAVFTLDAPEHRVLLRGGEIFERLGAAPWALATSAELERIPGSRPATPTLRLTPTEQRIAALVCDGLTNSQIAMRIFLSTKTVEANLSRIYRKVGVRSRVQLARTMAP